ncbi:complement C1q tumor necrosis factor-related protein 3-like [Branchiostoma lanceolatum]|uniref:complement C1q tumor necrosis factor-related protein 3-like n=1 Tax=Branchiostoma lanceolatum TaxID=7740 RepID=UPI003452CC47
METAWVFLVCLMWGDWAVCSGQAEPQVGSDGQWHHVDGEWTWISANPADKIAQWAGLRNNGRSSSNENSRRDALVNYAAQQGDIKDGQYFNKVPQSRPYQDTTTDKKTEKDNGKSADTSNKQQARIPENSQCVTGMWPVLLMSGGMPNRQSDELWDTLNDAAAGNGNGNGPTMPVFSCQKGDPGPAGPSGNPGTPGPSGIPGNHGNNGNNGLPGATGPPGEPGLKGDRGMMGEKGKTGAPGIPGVLGSKGIRGERGPPGQPGSGDTMVKKTAFSVGLTVDMNVQQDTDVVFDKIFTNIGGGYNITTGRFTASVHGAYFFSFHGYDYYASFNMWVKLLHNGREVVSIIDYDIDDTHDTASNSVILELAESDQVWLQLHAGHVIAGFKHTCTFSGHLLFSL